MDEITIDGQKHPIICLPGRPAGMLDFSVAKLYETETKEVNRARKNNPEKFPPEFAYQLTQDELAKVVEIFHHLKFSPVLPWCYTWEGCNMLATILKSDVATQRAIQIVRGFTAVEREVARLPEPTLPKLLPSLEQEAAGCVIGWLQVAQMFEVPAHLAQFEAVKAARRKTGIDYEPLLLAAPAQSQIPDGEKSLEPADIGRVLGIEGTEQRRGRIVNAFLGEIGWQVKRNGQWIAIGDGKPHATAHQWRKGDKSGYNLKWNLKAVLDTWREHRG